MSEAIRSRTPGERLLQSALLLGGCVLLAALPLSAYAVGKVGTAGLGGLAVAAAICLLAGWAAESLACALHDRVAPVAVMLLGMSIRMLPPLAICVLLAAQGARGREHLAFIVYLLTFYLITLALETWLTVARVARSTSPLPYSAR